MRDKYPAGAPPPPPTWWAQTDDDGESHFGTGGWPGSGASATAPGAKRGVRRTTVAAGGAVALVLVALAGVVTWRARSSGPTFPAKWDSRVTDIVAFDEKDRGLTYKHPVSIEFLSDKEFKASVTSSADSLTVAQRRQIDNITASLRALGLIGGGIDLFKAQNALSGGGTLAYYSSKTKTVSVRGTELTPAVRATLAHELTHVLQDQYFDLDASRNRFKTDGEKGAFRALLEGDAVGVENAYVKAMSPGDKTAYDDASKAQGASSGYDKAPPILLANFTALYTVGPPFVAALKAKGGTAAVDEALRHPPVSEAALLDLFTYLGANTVTPVDRPALKPGDKRLDDGDFGAITWYLMLARRLDVHEAVKAVDGWWGDSYLTYSNASGAVCVTVRYKGRTPLATDDMRKSLDAWLGKAAGPSDRVTRGADFVELNTCDPGANAKLTGSDRSPAAMDLLALRLQVNGEGLKQGAPTQLVECVGNGVIQKLTLDDLTTKDPAAPTRFKKVFNDAVVSCR